MVPCVSCGHMVSMNAEFCPNCGERRPYTDNPSSKCFIASSVYGNPDASELAVLSRWRDRWLSGHILGKAFVSTYYRVGPHLVQPIGKHALLRRVTRLALDAVVRLLRGDEQRKLTKD
jgi:predicted RNA-binding Zn-ribbon protein involved in translation (DUF1610 family)